MKQWISSLSSIYQKVMNFLQKKNVLDKASRVKDFTRHRIIGFNITDGYIFKAVVYIILISISYIYIFPLARMMSLSLMSLSDLLDPTIAWIPKHPTLDNFGVAARVLKIPTFDLENFSSFEAILNWFGSWGNSSVWNSLWFSVLLAVCQTIVSAFAGYAFARYNFAGKKFWMTMILLSFVIPIPLLMIPRTMLFVQIQDNTPFKMIGTITPQVLLAISGQGVYSTVLIIIFNNFFKMIPTVLDEAAKIDGASTMQVFYHIIIKMSMSTIVVVMLFSFVWNWNETFISGILLGSGMQLLPLQLGSFQALFDKMQQGAVGADGEPVRISEAYQMAATFITVVPLLIVYAFAQKRFIQGIEQTGITGE